MARSMTAFERNHFDTLLIDRPPALASFVEAMLGAPMNARVRSYFNILLVFWPRDLGSFVNFLLAGGQVAQYTPKARADLAYSLRLETSSKAQRRLVVRIGRNTTASAAMRSGELLQGILLT